MESANSFRDQGDKDSFATAHRHKHLGTSDRRLRRRLRQSRVKFDSDFTLQMLLRRPANRLKIRTISAKIRSR
jgi:hypothetical protein